MTIAADFVAVLEARADPAIRDGMKRFGIVTADRTLGIAVGDIRNLAKPYRRNHELALALWGNRHLRSTFPRSRIDDPAQITPGQMDHWRSAFDNWATCDTACFDLFDKTPHALDAVDRWASVNDEFSRRASFALHARKLPDQPFLDRLPLIEAAGDSRNFVKKGVNWALLAIGRRNPGLHRAGTALAERLAGSQTASERWDRQGRTQLLYDSKLLAKHGL